MAFDALMALLYDRFVMTLDGALDCVFVTNFDLYVIALYPPTPIRAPGGGIAGIIAGRALNHLIVIAAAHAASNPVKI